MKKALILIFGLLLAFSGVINAYGAEAALTDKGELLLEDYTDIELRQEDVSVSEEEIHSFLDVMPQDLADMGIDAETEVTDSMIREHSLLYFGEQLDTVEDAEAYIRSTLEESRYRDAFLEALRQLATVRSYPKDIYGIAADYAENEIAYYAYQEGIDEEELAILSGYGSAEEYIRMEAENYVKTSMILNRIMEEEGIAFREEDRDAALEEYMQTLGYDAYVSVEEFKETAGETWLWLFTEFRYKSGLVYEALKDRIHVTGS